MQKTPVELTLKGNIPIPADSSYLPVRLTADRVIIRYIPDTNVLIEGTDLVKADPEKSGFATGEISAIGDGILRSTEIPEECKKVGLPVVYTKGMAEEFFFGKDKYHMVRWAEIAYFL